MVHWACTESGCKVKQPGILWYMIGGEIGDERILERKALVLWLERQDGRVCKTRYRILFDKINEGCNWMIEDRLYKVKIPDGQGSQIFVTWIKSWKGIPN